MRKLSVIGFLVALLFVSCKDEQGEFQDEVVDGMEQPAEETTDTYSITYQYRDDVMVLTPKKLGYLEKVESDSILYFSKSIPQEIMPEEGLVMTCAKNDKLPYGLGNRVVSVTDEGGYYKCVTTSAALNQIFEQLEFSYKQLLTDTIDGFYDEDGNFHETEQVPYDELEYVENADTRASIGSPRVLVVPISSGSSGTGAGFYTSGSLAVGTIVTVFYDMADNTYECSMEFLGGLDAGIGVRAGCEGYKRLFRKKDLVKGLIPIGPITLRTYVDFELGIKGEVEGSISTSVSKQVGFKFGFKRDGATDGFFKENSTQVSNNLIKNLTVDAKGSVALVAKLSCGSGVYTRAASVGLASSFSAGVGVDFQLQEPNLFRNESALNVDFVNDLSAYFHLELFDKDLIYKDATFLQWNLFNWSNPLLPKLKDGSLHVDEQTGANDLLFDAGYELENKGVLYRFMDIEPMMRVYEGEEEVALVPYGSYLSSDGPGSFDFTLAGLKRDTEYKAVPCVMLGANIYEEEGMMFSASCPVKLTGVEVTGAHYYPDHYELGGHRYSFKYDCAVSVELDESGDRQIADWGYYYEDEYGQRAVVSLAGQTSPYTDTRYAYCKNQPEDTALFGTFVRYADDEEVTWMKPESFPLVYPQDLSLLLTDCVFQGTSTGQSFQGKTYDYKSTYKFYFTAAGAYWQRVSPLEEGSGWSGWQLPAYVVAPVDGANVLTVNYYYDSKEFGGEYRVRLEGKDNTHGNSCQSSGYALYSFDTDHFTGCTFQPGAATRGFADSVDGANEQVVNIVIR